ncbi:MAG: hypothetical protein ACON5J_08525 [Rubripirellula sp.]
MLRKLTLIGSMLILVLQGGLVEAQFTSELREALVAEVEKARSEVDGSLIPKLDSAKTTLLNQLRTVEKYFARNTDQQNGDAWMDYLKLSAIVDVLEQEGSDSELAKEAVILKDRLIGTVPGLELTVLTDLRNELDTLIVALRFKDIDSSVKMLDAQLVALGKLIGTVDDVPTPDQFSAISLRVDLLASTNQAPALIEALRGAFGTPNVTVRVSGDFISRVLSRDISRTEPVKDEILGTKLTGTAVMTGKVSASLIPSEVDAQLMVNLTGTVETSNDGVNGPVRLKSESVGEVDLKRTITLSEAGIDFSKTTSEVSLTTKITNMTAKSDLALRVGKKQSVKKKPQADRIAKEKLRRRVTEQFESEMDGLQAEASSRFLGEAKPVLDRLALSPPRQQWSSREDLLALDVTFRSPSQLSAINQASDFENSFSFAAQVHESVIANAFATILAGRTLDKDRLNELLENAGAPAPANEDEEESSFEISFSRSRPVIFEARDGKLKVGIRGTRFAQGDRTPLNKAMEITASYEVVTSESGSKALQRVGDVEVSFPRERLSIRDAGLKPIIQKEFSKIFPAVILEKSIQIAEDAEIETLRGSEFSCSEIKANLGWLSIAFQE